MKYRHLFFDLDHTLWDFDSNAKLTLADLFSNLELKNKGVHDFEQFFQSYLAHNEKLWSRYRNGYIKVDELRWKRMWHTLLEFGISDERLAREMGERFVQMLPGRNILFPHTLSVLAYLKDKGYGLHLITNGFEQVQHHKLRNSGLSGFFQKVITSEGSNSMKPKKEIFDFALQQAKAGQQESIMIGDCIEADIQGAMNAGLDQVFVNHTRQKCSVSPTYTINSLKELEAIF